jgi:hypothetical protein
MASSRAATRAATVARVTAKAISTGNQTALNALAK